MGAGTGAGGTCGAPFAVPSSGGIIVPLLAGREQLLLLLLLLLFMVGYPVPADERAKNDLCPGTPSMVPANGRPPLCPRLTPLPAASAAAAASTPLVGEFVGVVSLHMFALTDSGSTRATAGRLRVLSLTSGAGAGAPAEAQAAAAAAAMLAAFE